MRNAFLVFVFFISALFGGDMARAGTPASPPLRLSLAESRAADAISYVHIKWGDNEDANSVHLVTIDPRKYSVGVALPEANSAGYSLPRYLVADPFAVLAFTGGFLTTFLPATPRGLVKVDGVIRAEAIKDAPFADISDGVVCFASRRPQSADPEEPSLIAPLADARKERYPNCLQGGPLLVPDGRPRSNWTKVDQAADGFSSGLFPRAFVGETEDGHILLGVADPISLPMLTRILTDGALVLPSAAYAEGSPEHLAQIVTSSHGGAGTAVSGAATSTGSARVPVLRAALNLTGRNTAGLIGTVLDLDSPPLGAVDTLLPNAIIVRSATPKR